MSMYAQIAILAALAVLTAIAIVRFTRTPIPRVYYEAFQNGE